MQNNLVVLQRETKGLIELVKRLRVVLRDCSRRPIPRPAAEIDELAEEIDWPYIRDNLDRMIDRTRTGVKRVAGIIEKMRGLARTSPPQWEIGLALGSGGGALEIMRGRLKHQGVEVVVSLHDMTRIRCVPDQIGQVLLNLLINALQAIERAGRQEGGRIEVEARHEGPWVAISVERQRPRDRAANIGDDCSTPSSRPSPWAKGPGWGWRSATGSSPAMAAGSRSKASSAKGPASGFLLPQAPATRSVPPPPIADSPFSSRMTSPGKA